MLNHTSGIPDYDTQKGFNLRQDYTEEELVTFAAGLKLDFAPGSDWNYSNTGYVLLGVIVHRLLHDQTTQSNRQRGAGDPCGGCGF